jgi:glucosylceramidase
MNKDGKIVTVVMNPTDTKINYKLIVDANETALEIAPRAMQSIVY